jgi:hypothetical protein
MIGLFNKLLGNANKGTVRGLADTAFYDYLAEKRLTVLIKNGNGYLRYQNVDENGSAYLSDPAWGQSVRGFFVASREEARNDAHCQFYFVKAQVAAGHAPSYWLACSAWPGNVMFWIPIAGFTRLYFQTGGSLNYWMNANRVMIVPGLSSSNISVTEWPDGRVQWTTPLILESGTSTTHPVSTHSFATAWNWNKEFIIWDGCNYYDGLGTDCFNKISAFSSDRMFSFETYWPYDVGIWINDDSNKVSCCMRSGNSRVNSPEAAALNCTDFSTQTNYYGNAAVCDSFLATYCNAPLNADKTVCACFKLEKDAKNDPVLSRWPNLQMGCTTKCNATGVYRTENWNKQVAGSNCATQCVQIMNVQDINASATLKDFTQTCKVSNTTTNTTPASTTPQASTPTAPPPPPPTTTTTTLNLQQDQLLILGFGLLVMFVLLRN